MTLEEFRQELLRLFEGLGARPEVLDGILTVDADVNLFERSILDSLSLLALLDFIEATAGKEPDLDSIDPVEFFTLRSLHRLVSPSK